MEKQRSRKEKFSLFGPRAGSRATNASSSPSSSPVIPSAPTLQRPDRACGSGAPNLSKAEFLECVRRSNQACQQGEYALAVRLYSEALTADPQNCILYSNRSAAHLRLGQYNTALDDAVKARLINPKWPKEETHLLQTRVRTMPARGAEPRDPVRPVGRAEESEQ